MAVRRKKIHPQPHHLSVLIALQWTSRQVLITRALFLMTVLSSVGVPTTTDKLATERPRAGGHLRRQFPLDGQPWPLKQARSTLVHCLTTGPFRAGVETTKGSWAEGTRTLQAISSREHRDLPSRCQVDDLSSPSTSAITWCVVWLTTAALHAGALMEVETHRRSRLSLMPQTLP